MVDEIDFFGSIRRSPVLEFDHVLAAQNLKIVEVSEPNAPSAGEALVRMEYVRLMAATSNSRTEFIFLSDASFCHRR
jgi:hypothetical protein